MQRFYLYLAMTKPSELLTLSWTALSSEGKSMRPSSVIGQLKKRFPDLPVRSASSEKEGTISLRAAGKAVIAWLQDPEHMEQNPQFKELYRYLSGEGAKGQEMELLAEAAAYSYEESGIGKEAAKALSGIS